MLRLKKRSPAARKPVTNKNEVIQLYRQAILSGVPLDVIHQKVLTASEKAQITAQIEKEERQKLVKAYRKTTPLATRVTSRILPPVFIILGLILVGSAVLPIASYFLFTIPDLKAHLIAPVPEAQVLDVMPKVVTQVQATTKLAANSPSVAPTDSAQPDASDAPVISPTIDNTELDYTNLSNWFPNLELPSANNPQESHEYRLDIPSVDVVNALVRVGGSNLDKSLIQYPGTADPGQPGSPVIFGHSVLRQFYNPSEKNPRRYLSIFSKIMTLKNGDFIYVTQDNVRYTYQVRGREVVQPEDTFILDQDYSQKVLKIVTCVPEGTFLQRGVITANLIKSE